MPAAAIVTIVLGALIVAAAALGLVRVIGHLMAVTRTLDGVIGGVRAVAARTAPVPASVAYVNDELKPVRDFCEGI
ncbi:hypothetical protein [Nocardioides sp. KR10-350]|uniref:hypothetical protein n=1 Tax=Nocardioides cheoyonin TaxID=3156615 RepID=UPI0032B50A42